MKKLVYSRNIIYIILIIFSCFMPFLTAYFMSHDSSYFSSNTNFSINYNGSNLSTKQINDRLLDYSKKNNIAIAKRIYKEKNNRFESKTVIFGNMHYIKGLNKEKLRYTNDNSNLLTGYAVFNDDNPQKLFNYMNSIGLQINTWNPTSINSIINDTISIINNFYFNYLILFLVIIIILLNIFILLKKRKYNYIKKLFKGYSNTTSYIDQLFNETKHLFISSIIIEILLYIIVKIISPDLIRLALIASILLNILIMVTIIFSTILLIAIFNKFSIIEILKGKGNYNYISIISLVTIGFIFFEFANIIKSNIDSNIQITNLSKANDSWNKLKAYNLLDFNNVNPSDKSQKILSNRILNKFPEHKLLLSMDYNYYPSDKPPLNALMVNENYFNYQSIKYSNGQRITPGSLKHCPITLLTYKKLTNNYIKANYATALNTALKNIRVINIPKQKYYKYLTMDENQDQSFSTPNQVVVLNLHEAKKISPIVEQNILAWASQRQLMFKSKNINNILNSFLNIKNIESTNIFRAKIQHTIYFNHYMLMFNLILSILVVLVCCYFTIYILFSSKRKKLFLMKINGKTFLRRYISIYISLIVSITPGIVYLFMNSNNLAYVITIIIVLIFTLQIWMNEQNNYSILKGKL
ncbi:hypothetical protein [Apilactobacillus quenuiae]|uniref:hypothetical protein n=1 Tax=Apilactobacillus quenuiae TaxID=2008377 RepID=UPI000D019221|nr:hypothetical protein [Apilactobacillus quenuiae]